MNNLSRITVLMLLLATFFNQAAHAEGGWISGGGDPLRFYFLEGKELASEWLMGMDEKQFPSASPEIKAWILTHRAEIADDVMKSTQGWTTSSQITCGLTQFNRNAEILLSVTSCRSISTAEEAAKMLLHESVHHFGIKDEAFADQVALTIAATWENTKLTHIPSCTQSDDRLAQGILGQWSVDQRLTQKLGGSLILGPKGVLTLQEDLAEKKKFQAFGHCAMSAGRLILETTRGKRVLSYLLVDYRGTAHLVTLSDSSRPPRPPRFHRRGKLPGLYDGIQPWSLQLIRSQDPSRDFILLGESESEEALTAFHRLSSSLPR